MLLIEFEDVFLGKEDLDVPSSTRDMMLISGGKDILLLSLRFPPCFETSKIDSPLIESESNCI